MENKATKKDDRKQVIFRLSEDKFKLLDDMLVAKCMDKQSFFNKCVDLFLSNNLPLDSQVIANDSSELSELRSQIEIINDRLSKLEDNSQVIANDSSSNFSILTNKLDDLSAIVTNLKGTNTRQSDLRGNRDDSERANFDDLFGKLSELPKGYEFTSMKAITDYLGITVKYAVWKKHKLDFLALFDKSEKGIYNKK